MKAIGGIQGGRRWLVCGGLLGLSLLLIGAGRMNGEIKDRQSALLEMKAECEAAAQGMTQGLPMENRNTWETLAVQNPALLIKASHGALRHIAGN